MSHTASPNIRLRATVLAAALVTLLAIGLSAAPMARAQSNPVEDSLAHNGYTCEFDLLLHDFSSNANQSLLFNWLIGGGNFSGGYWVTYNTSGRHPQPPNAWCVLHDRNAGEPDLPDDVGGDYSGVFPADWFPALVHLNMTWESGFNHPYPEGTHICNGYLSTNAAVGLSTPEGAHGIYLGAGTIAGTAGQNSSWGSTPIVNDEYFDYYGFGSMTADFQPSTESGMVGTPCVEGSRSGTSPYAGDVDWVRATGTLVAETWDDR